MSSGDTLSVIFFAGGNSYGGNTSGGGVIEATFIVDSTRYSTTVDTRLQAAETWQSYSHDVEIANSCNVSVEFKRLNAQ